jgi:PAS domain S-box-containing protein
LDSRSPQSDQVRDALSWREEIVTWVLRLYCLVGLPTVIWFEFLVFERGAWLVAAAIAALQGLVTWAAFLPGLSFPNRARILLWFLYLSGALGLASIGPLAGGNVLLFAFVVVSAMVNGRRGAIQGSLLAAATMIVTGALHVGGWITGVETRPITAPAPWITSFALLVVLSSSVAASLTFLVSRLESSLAQSRDLIARLQERSRQRDRAESELRTSAERLRTIVDNATDVIFTMTSGGTITFASPSSMRTIGRSGEELEGVEMAELVHPDDLEAFTAGLARVVSGAATNSITTYRIRHKDGSWRMQEASLSPIMEEDGNIPYVVGIAKDVTVERELEEQLRQSQKMEALGKLAGGVAHDFNNLLTVISGYSSLLLHSSKSDPDLLEASRAIEEAAQSGAALTRQLLAFSRRRVTQPAPLDVNGVVDRVRQMLERLIAEDIELEIDLDPRLPPVLAGVTQIEQVLMNLVINASDAIGKRGVIRVSTERVAAAELELRASGTERGVRITVSDDGCGMTQEIMAQIFEPFFTTKESGSGTGLGLSTVYGIVQEIEGHLRVSSQPGRGTTFEIDLPGALATAPAVEAVEPATEHVPGGATVLVVEDQSSVRSVAKQMLKEAGYDVIVAADGQDALETAASHDGRIDILLTDIRMPRLGGVELAKRLRQRDPNLQIVLMSGFSELAEGMTADGLSGVKLVDKPFTQADLLAAIAGDK